MFLYIQEVFDIITRHVLDFFLIFIFIFILVVIYFSVLCYIFYSKCMFSAIVLSCIINIFIHFAAEKKKK